ncbi:MAG TPA: hypothetical protein DCP84_02175 [Pseudomonas sp.]|nr:MULTISPECIES: hypothetical protein [Pseudomonas]HAL66483.1 hypothetical protein [Pseudomonas sp.]
MKHVWLLSFLLVIGGGSAHWAEAAPRPFFLWQSLVTGRYICVQGNPGSGWTRFAGPYKNGACRDH